MLIEPASLLLVDPAWKFRDKLPGKKRGAAKHYRCKLTVKQLMAYELPPLDENCLMIMWRVAAMQQEALDVARAWGFRVKSELVWLKLRKSGKRHFGMGHYVRAGHETALICTRGRVKVATRSQRSVFDAVMPTHPNGKLIHSAKPDEIYAIARGLMPKGTAFELFARQQWPGWICLGDEAEKGGGRRLFAVPEEGAAA